MNKRESLSEFAGWNEASFRRYVLSQLQMAGLRARYLVSTTRALWKAVRHGDLDAETALCLLDDACGLDLISPGEPDTLEKNICKSQIEQLKSQCESK